MDTTQVVQDRKLADGLDAGERLHWLHTEGRTAALSLLEHLREGGVAVCAAGDRQGCALVADVDARKRWRDLIVLGLGELADEQQRGEERR